MHVNDGCVGGLSDASRWYGRLEACPTRVGTAHPYLFFPEKAFGHDVDLAPLVGGFDEDGEAGVAELAFQNG
jgi:hypothetical protein